jgi:hypothetical protein
MGPVAVSTPFYQAKEQSPVDTDGFGILSNNVRAYIKKIKTIQHRNLTIKPMEKPSSSCQTDRNLTTQARSFKRAVK